MATMYHKKRSKLYQDGGLTYDFLNDQDFINNTIGDRRLKRRLRRANRGRKGAQRRLQELENLYHAEQAGQAGADIGIDPRTGNFLINGNSVDIRERSGFGKAIQGIVGTGLQAASPFLGPLGLFTAGVGKGINSANNSGIPAQQFFPQNQPNFTSPFNQPVFGGYDPSQILGQTPFGSGFGSPFGGSGFGSGGFGLGDVFNSIGSLGSLFSNLSSQNQQKGGSVRKYQQGGLVDFQAEKGEMLYHPTGYLTSVHAKKTHKQMEKAGDGDMVTDHSLQDSFVFSDFLKVKKSDAADMIIGVKRHPYKEGEKGKEPEVYKLSDLYKKGEKKLTPAKLAKRVGNMFKVTNDHRNIFNVLGDQMNMENRKSYLEAIASLSEVEREQDDMLESVNQLEKGGNLRRRGIYKAQVGLPDIITSGQFPELPERQTPPPFDFLPTLPTYVPNDYSGARDIGPSPLDSFLEDIYGTGQSSPYGQGTYTQYVDQGSPFLRGLGEYAIPIGGALTTGANLAGAAGAYGLYNNLVNETPAFYDEQRGFANRSRDIASLGNLFDAGLVLSQQGPAELPTNNASRLKQFDPYRQVDMARRLASDSLGRINSLVRNNPNSRAINIGNAIATNNQSIAQAYGNAFNQEFQIGQQLDAVDFQNSNIRAQNEQNRTDFGNNLLQQTRQPFGGFFGNEASRQLDLAGLNTAQRQDDITFRQNRLFTPLQYLSAAGNSLSNLGATAISAGTNYVPQQVPYGQTTTGNQGNNFLQGIFGAANILDTLGVFGK